MHQSTFLFRWVAKPGLFLALATTAVAAPVTYGPGSVGLIPAATSTNFTLNVPDSVVIADVNIGINLTHTWDADLDIFLISPLGTIVELTTNNGGSGDNYTNTLFDDEASVSITAGAAPFTGSFQPEGLLSDFDAENALGLWTLRIDEYVLEDSGELLSWSLTIDEESTGGGDPPSVPEPGTLSLLGAAGLAVIGIRWRRRA